MKIDAYLLWSHWLLGSLVELLDGLLVVAKILLASDEDDWETLAEMKDLRDPLESVLARAAVRVRSQLVAVRGRIYLLLNIVKGIWRVDREADQDDVRVWVGQWTKTIVILLTGGIPQGQLDVLAINLDVGDVVRKDGWDVDLKQSRG